MSRRLFGFSAAVLVAFFSIGCGSQNGGHSAAEIEQYNKQRNIDPGKVTSFLNQLAAVPQTQRRDFMSQHSDDMRALSQDQDPDVQARYQKILRNGQ